MPRGPAPGDGAGRPAPGEAAEGAVPTGAEPPGRPAPLVEPPPVAPLGGAPSLAGREPLARLLLGLRGLVHGRGGGRGGGGGRRRGGARGRARALRRRCTGPRAVAALGRGVGDGCTHDHGRDGPRPGDVDPDPCRQGCLGLALLRRLGERPNGPRRHRSRKPRACRTAASPTGTRLHRARWARRTNCQFHDSRQVLPVGSAARLLDLISGSSAARTTILAMSGPQTSPGEESRTGPARDRYGELVRHLPTRALEGPGCRP